MHLSVTTPSTPPAITAAVLQSHPQLSEPDMPGVVAIGTQEGQIPLSIETALLGADALVSVRALPISGNGVSDTIDVHRSDEFAMQMPSPIPGAPGVLWTDSAMTSIYRVADDAPAWMRGESATD